MSFYTHEAAMMMKNLPDDRELIGAEVGVLRARTACAMLQNLPLLKLTLVDNWLEESEGPTGAAVKAEAMRNLSRFSGRYIILEGDSTDAAQFVQDSHLDYVLIDADHTYPKCLDDMLAWWPKVLPEGIMFHHDIDHASFQHWGVRRAVEEFCAMNALTFEVDDTTCEIAHMAIIRKPE